MITTWIKAVRIKQWIKNLLLFVPAILAGRLAVSEYATLLIGFLLFSLLASAGYLLNDIKDRVADSLHPVKRNRPIASGLINVRTARLMAYVLIISVMLVGWLLFSENVLYLLFYFVLNTLYAYRLKQERFLDVIVLSSFYLIRIFFGAAILDLTLTGWFVGTLTFASLGLGLSKRYMELLLIDKPEDTGRSYKSEDTTWLLPLMYSTVLIAVLFLNIHAFFVLNVTQSWFYALLNLLSFGIVLFYFDQLKDKQDDPIERILKNRLLLFFFAVLVLLYVGMMFYNK